MTTGESLLVARHWHGRVWAERAASYRAVLEQTGLTDLRALPGNRGVLLVRRADGPVVHFDLLSFWDSEDAIRAFTGPETSRARYYAADREFLLELEDTCAHFPWRGFARSMPPLPRRGPMECEFLPPLAASPRASRPRLRRSG